MAGNLGAANLYLRANDQGLGKDLARAKAGVTKTMKSVGAGLTAFGGMVVGSLGFAVSEAAEFQKAMSEVATLGPQQMDALNEGVRKVARTYGKDLADSAQAAYQVISATGTDGAEAIGILEEATKAAVAGVSNVTASVELGTSVMNAFGKSSGEVGRIYDEAFVAVKNGMTKFDELAGSVGRVAPMFSAAGLSSREMFASVSALTKAGINTSEAVSSLKAALSNVLKPSESAATLAEQLGLKFDAQALSAKGLHGFLQDVGRATGGDVEKMSQLFGSVESLNAVLALTGQQAGDFAKNMNDMGNSTGATDKAFKEFTRDNFAYNWSVLTAHFKELRIAVVNELLPVLGDLIAWLRPILMQTAKWIKNTDSLSGKIIVAVGAVGAFSAAFGPLLLALSSLNLWFVGFLAAGGVGWAFGTWLNNMAQKVGFLRKFLADLFDVIYDATHALGRLFGMLDARPDWNLGDERDFDRTQRTVGGAGISGDMVGAGAGRSMSAGGMSGGGGYSPSVVNHITVAGGVRNEGDIERIARRLRDLTLDGLARRGVRYGV